MRGLFFQKIFLDFTRKIFKDDSSRNCFHLKLIKSNFFQMPSKNWNIVCLFPILSTTLVTLQRNLIELCFLDCINRISIWVILISSAHTHTHTHTHTTKSFCATIWERCEHFVFIQLFILYCLSLCADKQNHFPKN